MRGLTASMVWRHVETKAALLPPCLAGWTAGFRWPVGAMEAPSGGEVLAWTVDELTGGRRVLVEGRGEGIRLLFDGEASLDALEGETLHGLPDDGWLAGVPSSWVPGLVRFAAHRAMVSPGPLDGELRAFWPCDPSGDFLQHLLQGSLSAEAVAARPRNFALTVDVDTAGGLKGLGEIAALAGDLDLPVTAFVTGEVLLRRGKDLGAFLDGGNEIGLHGWCHDRRLALLEEEALRRRFADLPLLRRDFALKGFRAPNFLRSPTLDAFLLEEEFWDSSVPDSDVDSLLGPWRGCARSRAHRRGRLLCLPPTFPLDDRLLLQGLDGSAMAALWFEKLEFLHRLGGTAVFTLHGEPHLAGHGEIRRGLRAFLEGLVGAGVWQPVTMGALAAVACPSM